jgi:hypothetical protein
VIFLKKNQAPKLKFLKMSQAPGPIFLKKNQEPKLIFLKKNQAPRPILLKKNHAARPIFQDVESREWSSGNSITKAAREVFFGISRAKLNSRPLNLPIWYTQPGVC